MEGVCLYIVGDYRREIKRIRVPYNPIFELLEYIFKSTIPMNSGHKSDQILKVEDTNFVQIFY